MTVRIELKSDCMLPGSVLACQKWHQATETRGDLHIIPPGLGQTFFLGDHEILMVAEVKPRNRRSVGLPDLPDLPAPTVPVPDPEDVLGLRV